MVIVPVSRLVACGFFIQSLMTDTDLNRCIAMCWRNPPIQPVVRQTDLSKECPFKVVNKSRSSLYVQ